jgi:hypothetical protein
MATTFADTIKPYFSECYREHMSFMFDLWSPDDVKANWQAIYNAVQNKSMPRPGCPEGVWDDHRRAQFLRVVVERRVLAAAQQETMPDEVGIVVKAHDLARGVNPADGDPVDGVRVVDGGEGIARQRQAVFQHLKGWPVSGGAAAGRPRTLGSAFAAGWRQAVQVRGERGVERRRPSC